MKSVRNFLYKLNYWYLAAASFYITSLFYLAEDKIPQWAMFLSLSAVLYLTGRNNRRSP